MRQPRGFCHPYCIQKPPQINRPKIRIFGICRQKNFVVYCDCRLGKAQLDKTKILSSQSKGKKDKIMTKNEKAMFEEMLNTIKALNERIDNLEKAKTVSRTESVKSDSKDSKKSTEVVVGNLIFDGKYVKTGTGFMSSKTRYAIGKSITEDFGGTKLSKGNAVYDKCHKSDKYVQVYEFKTVADCKKFMAEQQKIVG